MGTLSVDKILKTSTGAAEFTLPATDGTSGQAMITDGSGQLSLGDITFANIQDISTANRLVGAVTVGTITEVQAQTDMIADNAVTLPKMEGITRGSVIIGNATSDPSYLAIGASGQVLTSDGSDMAWAAASAPALTSFKLRFQNNGTPQSISDATNTKVTLDTADWDTASGADLANNRWVCPSGEAGNYIFSIAGYLQDMSNAFAVRGMLYKNGTYSMGTDGVGQPRGTFTQINTGSTHMHYYMASGSQAVALAVNDYVETWIFGDWASGSKNCTYGHLIGTKVS